MKTILDKVLADHPEEIRDIAMYCRTSFENLSEITAASRAEMTETERIYAIGFTFGVACAGLKMMENGS